MGSSHPTRRPGAHQVLQQGEMILMLSRPSESWRRHDVRGGIETLSSRKKIIQDFVVARTIEAIPFRSAKVLKERLPRFDPIKELKQEDTEEDFLDPLGAFVDHVFDQVLTNPISCSIRVSKPISRQHRVVSPWGSVAPDTLEEYLLALGCESPVGLKDRSRQKYSATGNP